MCFISLQYLPGGWSGRCVALWMALSYHQARCTRCEAWWGGGVSIILYDSNNCVCNIQCWVSPTLYHRRGQEWRWARADHQTPESGLSSTFSDLVAIFSEIWFHFKTLAKPSSLLSPSFFSSMSASWAPVRNWTQASKAPSLKRSRFVKGILDATNA